MAKAKTKKAVEGPKIKSADQVLDENKVYKEMLETHMQYINDLHKRINELELVLDDHRAVISVMRGRLGV